MNRPKRLVMRVLLMASMLCSGAVAAQTTVPQTSASLRGLSVPIRTVIWASGNGGTYLRSIDGGQTWNVSTVPGAAALDFRGVKAFDKNRAVLMSSGPAEEGKAKIYRTVDGGRTWTLVYSTEKKGVFFDTISFWDADHGIVLSDPVDGHFLVFLTDDGGRSWKEGGVNVVALPREGAFAASNSCLVVHGRDEVWFGTGGSGMARVFHSGDRGRTWTVVSTPMSAATASAGIFSIAFRDRNHGVAVGGDYQQPTGSAQNAIITSDGGRTWRLAAEAADHLYLSSVAYGGNSSQVMAVGTAGCARSDDGGLHWSLREGEGFNALAFNPTGLTAWAVGASGRVSRINNCSLMPNE